MPAYLAPLGRAIRNNPKKSIAGFGSLLLWLWNRFNDYQTGSGLMTGWLGPNWPTVVFESVTQSVWFDVALFVVAIGCFVWIAVCAKSGETESSKRTAIALSEQAELLSSFKEDIFNRLSPLVGLPLRVIRLMNELQRHQELLGYFNGRVIQETEEIDYVFKLTKGYVKDVTSFYDSIRLRYNFDPYQAEQEARQFRKIENIPVPEPKQRLADLSDLLAEANPSSDFVRFLTERYNSATLRVNRFDSASQIVARLIAAKKEELGVYAELTQRTF